MLKKRLLALGLVLGATFCWANTDVSPLDQMMEKGDLATGSCLAAQKASMPTKAELAERLKLAEGMDTTTWRQWVAKNFEPAANNCLTWLPSCGKKTGCVRVFGGSQYIYNNRIPSCKDDRRACFDVRCRVVSYDNPNCSGEPEEDSFTTQRGCKGGGRG